MVDFFGRFPQFTTGIPEYHLICDLGGIPLELICDLRICGG